MLILIEPSGQTSNHFIQHVRLDSFCREHKIRFFNIPMMGHLKEFPNVKLFSRSDMVGKFFVLIFKVLRRLTLVNYLDFNDSKIGEEYSNKPEYFRGRLVFCSGWYLKQDELFGKYRDCYKKEMQPKIDNAEELKLQFLNKAKDELILGVHIRRGDYKYYREGRFYFEDDVYLNYMLQFEKLIDKRLRIIIFTNDNELDLSYYQEKLNNNVVISRSTVAEDYFLMASCDYLLSTISTFPLWVCYISGTKLYRVSASNEILLLSNFKDVDVICQVINKLTQKADFPKGISL